VTAAVPRPAVPRSADVVAGYVEVALANVTREFPHATSHVLRGPDESSRPRDVHPAFHGSFDWHSCVHVHAMLVRALTDHPDLVPADRVRAVLDATLTPRALEVEARYLLDNDGFERPYGWAWAVTLAAWCRACPDPAATAWSVALEPLAAAVDHLTLAWLPRIGRPVRDGSHANTAFALGLLVDGFTALGTESTALACSAAARDLFHADRDVPAAWEPGGEDFLSPALVEADLVARVSSAGELADWLTTFLPGAADGVPATLFEPAQVTDPSDGRLGHLSGLLLSRAWPCARLAAALPVGDPRIPVFTRAAERSLAVGLPHVVSGRFTSDHWLVTFALLALHSLEQVEQLEQLEADGPATAR